jgi:hypothetical protein
LQKRRGHRQESTLTAPPATGSELFISVIWPFETATDVTATMIGNPVAA